MLVPVGLASLQAPCVCLRALPAALQVDSFLLFNLPVGKAKETGERGRGAGSGELGGPALPRLTPGPSLHRGRRLQSQRGMAPCKDSTLALPALGGPMAPCTPASRQPEEPRARVCSHPSRPSSRLWLSGGFSGFWVIFLHQDSEQNPQQQEVSL